MQIFAWTYIEPSFYADEGNLQIAIERKDIHEFVQQVEINENSSFLCRSLPDGNPQHADDEREYIKDLSKSYKTLTISYSAENQVEVFENGDHVSIKIPGSLKNTFLENIKKSTHHCYAGDLFIECKSHLNDSKIFSDSRIVIWASLDNKVYYC